MNWPAFTPDPLTTHQVEQLTKATSGGNLAVFGGSPGTGKSFTAAQVVRAFGQTMGYHHIAVAAPTGKAAVRMSEALNAYNIPLRAVTWHTLMGVQQVDGDGWEFEHNRANPLPWKLLVGDEMSMCDTDLAKCIFAARAPGTKFLCIGDVNQLPPVGHGAPLRDMIRAGCVPYGELREILRNSGGIVQACADIRDGRAFRCDGNLRSVRARGANAVRESLLTTIGEASQSFGIDAVWDVQVLVAVNKKGDLCRKNLNQLLQKTLNPNPEIPGNPFRRNDKVVNLKNGWFRLSEHHRPNKDEQPTLNGDETKAYVANGELGEAIIVEGNVMHVRLSSPARIVIVPRGKATDDDNEDEDSSGTGCNWDLGYALSVHKCVHPDTIVETEQGLKPIRKIASEGIIGTHSGPWAYRNRVYYEKADSLKVTTKDGGEITVSRNHRCEVWRNDSWTMVDAADLREGEYVRSLLACGCLTTEEVILPPRGDEDCRCADIEIPTRMSADLAELFGLIVADGCVFKSGVRLGKRHPEVAKRFSELCLQLFGVVNAEFEQLGMLVSECRSTAVRNWLLKVGGMAPNAKYTPECILESNCAIHASFLRGLFEDGTVNVRDGKLDHIEWVTCYPRLDREVREMLRRLGVICGRNSRKSRLTQLYIYGAEAKKFGDKIGFISEFKRERLKCEAGEQTRYRIPLSRIAIEATSRYMTKSALQNARRRGYISRATAESMIEAGYSAASAWLEWHYSPIATIEPVTCPVMCVEVPGLNRFLQNGFAWGNSQGSEWPVAIVVLDDSGGAQQVCTREWIYTAISRAKTACYLVGPLEVAQGFVRRTAIDKRKTFLAERIRAGFLPF